MSLSRFAILFGFLTLLVNCGRSPSLLQPPPDAGGPQDSILVVPDAPAPPPDAPGPVIDFMGVDQLVTPDLAVPPDLKPPLDYWFWPLDTNQPPDLPAPSDSYLPLDLGQPPDMLLPDLLSPDMCAILCGAACCKPGQVCLAAGGCTTPVGKCVTNADCFNDSYCHQGVCVPYGKGPGGSSNPACLGVVPLGRVAPTDQCSWTAPPAGDKHPKHRSVLGTPVVMKWPIPNKGDVPFIAFVTYDRSDGGGAAARCDGGAFGVIRLIRGSDCKQMYSVDGVKVRASSPLAVADLDGDKMPELVAYRCGGGVVAVKYDKNSDSFILGWTSSPATAGATEYLWSGPSVHDLDGDGKPEVLMGGIVFDNTGKQVDGALGTLTPSGHSGGIAVAVDMDGDGKVEMADGRNVYQWDTLGKKWQLEHSSKLTPGLVAVADLGTYGADPTKDDRSKLDGVAEVVVVHGGAVRAQTLAGRVVFGPIKATSGQGGPPTVGDFDNDGRAELAFAGRDKYTVADPDCKAGAVKAHCPSLRTDSILWTSSSQDHTSSSTGSSIFDFDGDGEAEAIYADECFTRVYDGASGQVIYSHYHTSCTWYENPVVADVDGDLRSELVVPSNSNCSMASVCTGKLPKLPGSSLGMDPVFRGLRCTEAAQCASGVCTSGICRCTTDAHCGGAAGPYRCGPAVTGTPGTGKVCRSVMLGGTVGIQVLRDTQDKWVGSRPVWNQHAYAVTNVNDDGTIPYASGWKPNHKEFGLNNFRQNVQGKLQPSAIPDLTSKPGSSYVCSAAGLTVSVAVCNRGAKTLPNPIPVTVYQGAKPGPGSSAACISMGTKLLKPGACETLTCTISPAPKTATDLYAVANDDGTGKPSLMECQGANNWSLIKGVSCP